jgi:hypothetical protein
LRRGRQKYYQRAALLNLKTVEKDGRKHTVEVNPADTAKSLRTLRVNAIEPRHRYDTSFIRFIARFTFKLQSRMLKANLP